MGWATGLRTMAALAAGPLLIAVGVALGARPFADFEAYERAPLCASPPPADTGHCVTRMPMTVIKRSTYTTEDPDPPQFPQQPPPPPPPPMGPFRVVLPAVARTRGVLASQTTHYRITIRTADGRYHEFEVGHAFYKVAEAGATGTADLWHGRVMRLRIGTRTDDEWAGWRAGVSVLISLAGVVVFVVVVILLIRQSLYARRREWRGPGVQGSPWGAW